MEFHGWPFDPSMVEPEDLPYNPGGETVEIAYIEPMVMSASDEPGIKAGMMSVIPHVPDEDKRMYEIPEGTVICAGQTLLREQYPKLSQVYASSGGFYTFTLPDLTNKFICGFNAYGEFILGDGIVYYEDIPNTDPPSRSVVDG